MRWSAGERGSGGALSKKAARGGSALSGASEAGRKGRNKARVEWRILISAGRRDVADRTRVGSGAALLGSSRPLDWNAVVLSCRHSMRRGEGATTAARKGA